MYQKSLTVNNGIVETRVSICAIPIPAVALFAACSLNLNAADLYIQQSKKRRVHGDKCYLAEILRVYYWAGSTRRVAGSAVCRVLFSESATRAKKCAVKLFFS